MKNKILALALLSTFANININATDDIDDLIASMSGTSKPVEKKDNLSTSSILDSTSATPKQPSLSRSIFGTPTKLPLSDATSGLGSPVAKSSPAKVNPQQQKIKDLELKVSQLEQDVLNADAQAQKKSEKAIDGLKQDLGDAKRLHQEEVKKLEKEKKKEVDAIQKKLTAATDRVADLETQLKKEAEQAEKDYKALEDQAKLEIKNREEELALEKKAVEKLKADLKDAHEHYAQELKKLEQKKNLEIEAINKQFEKVVEELRQSTLEVATLKSTKVDDKIQQALAEEQQKVAKKDEMILKMKEALVKGKAAKEEAEAATLEAVNAFDQLKAETFFILKILAAYMVNGDVADDDVISSLEKQQLQIDGNDVSIEPSAELVKLLQKEFK